MIELKLKKLMRNRNLTIQDIFEKTNISRNTISQMINKEPKGIQFDTLEKIIKAYDLQITDLLEYVDDSPAEIYLECDGIIQEDLFEDVFGDEENNVKYISSIEALIPFKLHVKNVELNVIIPAEMKLNLSIAIVETDINVKVLEKVTISFIGNQFSNSIYRLFPQRVIVEIEQYLIDFVAEQVHMNWNDHFEKNEASYEITNL